MAQIAQPQQHELTVVKVLASVAVLAALVAAVAGLVLIVAAPEAGSTAEGTLGITAAISGLATAGFAIAAAIYAQVKGLWRYAPTWLRVAVWAAIAYAFVMAVWRSNG